MTFKMLGSTRILKIKITFVKEIRIK